MRSDGGIEWDLGSQHGLRLMKPADIGATPTLIG